MINKFDTLVIEINNKCNLKCHQCIYSKINRVYHEITVNEMRHVLNEALKLNIKKIRILGLAEPTLHSKFKELINCCQEYNNIEYHLLTNGTTLNNQNIFMTLKNSSIDLIEFSIDAYYKTTYNKVRNNLYDFNKIVDNIIKLSHSIRESSKTQIAVSFVMHPETIIEVKSFISFWQNKVDKIILREPHNFSNNVNYFDSQKIISSHVEQCDFIKHKIFVDCFMKVHLCKMDFQNKLIIGDLKETSLKDIFDSEFYNYLINGKCQYLNNICNKCSGGD